MRILVRLFLLTLGLGLHTWVAAKFPEEDRAALQDLLLQQKQGDLSAVQQEAKEASQDGQDEIISACTKRSIRVKIILRRLMVF